MVRRQWSGGGGGDGADVKVKNDLIKDSRDFPHIQCQIVIIVTPCCLPASPPTNKGRVTKK